MNPKLKYLFEKHGEFFKDQQKEIARLLRSTMKFHWHEGRWYPSVTSIINPTGYSRFVAPYASRGSIVHYLIKRYIEAGQWLDWHDCAVLEKDIYIVETSKRKIRIEDANYMGFFLEYGGRFTFDRDSLEKRFFNGKHFYTGRPDVRALYNDAKIHHARAFVDYKTIGTYGKKELEIIFMQLAAYAFGYGWPEAIGVCIPLNGKTKIGYAEPIVCRNLKPYFDMFLKRRQALLDLYGI